MSLTSLTARTLPSTRAALSLGFAPLFWTPQSSFGAAGPSGQFSPTSVQGLLSASSCTVSLPCLAVLIRELKLTWKSLVAQP